MKSFVLINCLLPALLTVLAISTAHAQPLAPSAPSAPSSNNTPISTPTTPSDAKLPLNVDVPAGTRLLLPRNANSCVGFWEPGVKGRVATFDAKTGRMITVCQKPIEINNGAALSQDGKLLINPPRFGATGVDVWNLATSTKIATVASGDDGQTQVIDFLPDEKVLIAQKLPKNRYWTLQQWDYRNKQLLHSLDLESDFDLTSASVDPLGKTLIYVGVRTYREHVARLVDAQTLQPLDRKPKLKRAHGYSTLDSRADTTFVGLGNLHSCRFSPDSKLVAVATGGAISRGFSTDFHLVILDVATATEVGLMKVASSREWDSVSIDSKSRYIAQWSQGGTRILALGEQIWDVQTGAMLYQIPARYTGHGSEANPKILIGNDFFLQTRGFDPRSGSTMLKFDTARLPVEKMARALQAVKAGGDAIDGYLPPLKTITWSDVPAIKAAGTPIKPIEPDPAPPVKLMTKSQVFIDLRKTPDFQNSNYAKFTPSGPGILFPSIPSDRALVYGELKPGPDTDSLRAISLINLDTGLTLNQTIDTTGGQPVALSADGRRLALRSARKDGYRMDIYELSSGPAAPTHIVGWVLPGSTWANWCAFVDNDTLLLQANNDLVAFRLPDAQPLYKILAAQNPALSPGARQVFFRSDSHVYCANTKTGEMLADITGPLPNPTQRESQFFSSQMAISPDAKQMSILRGTGHMVVTLQVYPLDTPRPGASDVRKIDFYEPTQDKFGNILVEKIPVKYLAPGHLLLPSGLMIQTEQGTPVIYYKFWGQCAGLAMGRYWNVTWDPAAARYSLTSTPVPSENVLKLATRFNRDDFVLYTTPLKAKLEFSPPPQCANPQQVRDSILARLNQIGINPDQDSQSGITFKVSANIESDPTAKYYRSTSPFSFFAPPEGTPTYEVKRMVGHAELIRDGKVVWTGDAVISGSLPRVTQDQDVDAALTKAAWDAYPSTILNTTSSFPAMLMDYSRIEKVSLGAGPAEGKVQAGTEGIAQLSDNAKDTLKDEYRILLRYKTDADLWLADAQALQASLAAGKVDIKKFRTSADALANLKRLNVPTDVMAESTRQKLVSIKEAASKATKQYQAAYSAFASQQAGRAAQDPNTLLANAKDAIEKTIKPGLEAISARIKEIEEKTK
jgi:hypothetical protein